MTAPRDIVDALECVASIYFSDVRQKTRAAFILADEMVEVCCKALAIAENPKAQDLRESDISAPCWQPIQAKTWRTGAG